MGGAVDSSRSFRAMGSDFVARVVVDNDRAEPILDRVVERVRDLEQRWTRFNDASELSQLNAYAGAPVFVSPETFALVALALEATRATGGYFDPTMLEAVRSAGYDQTFELVADRSLISTGSTASISISGSVSIDEIELDARSSMIHTPPGLHFDFGGIGKGRAADLIFEQLIAEGVEGACLDFGGDIRVGGSPVDGGGWAVVVDDPFHPTEDLAVLGIGEGSVTTSSRLRRSWPTATGPAHHLIDPSTGRSAQSGIASVTVIAALAAWGEVHAKAAVIAGREQGRRLIEEAGLSALFVADDGGVTTVGEFERFIVDGSTLSA